MSRESIIGEVRAEIARLQQVLTLLGESTPRVQKPAGETPVPATRQISAAGRRRIGAAARARWAKIRAAKTPGKVPGSGVPRRKMSASARKRIAAAQKARWAKIRAGKK